MWDKRYDTPAYVFGTEPSIFLRQQVDLLTTGGDALAIADGEGRNSVFMAECGLHVKAMDNSSVGLEKARQLAKSRGVNVNFQLADVSTWEWAPAQYNIVAAIFIQFANPSLRETIFEGIERTLKPGGLLLLHGYTPRQLAYGTGGPKIEENLYEPDMLAARFSDWDVQRLAEYEVELDEGTGHCGMSALVDLIARRPLK